MLAMDSLFQWSLFLFCEDIAEGPAKISWVLSFRQHSRTVKWEKNKKNKKDPKLCSDVSQVGGLGLLKGNSGVRR